LYILTNN